MLIHNLSSADAIKTIDNDEDTPDCDSGIA
jgi:hypothetical protein